MSGKEELEAMVNIRSYMSRPFPMPRAGKRQFVLTLITGIFVTILLSIYFPFASTTDSSNSWVLIGFALVAILTGILNTVVLPHYFTTIFDDDSWTIGREIAFSVFHLVSIALAILIYGRVLEIITITLSNLLLALFYTAFFGIIPIAVKTLLAQNYYLKRHLKIADRLNDLLLRTNYPGTQSAELTLVSEGRKEHMRLRSESLLCVLAEQNYVKVVWINSGEIKSDLLRMSMNQVLSQLVDPFIVRCHRSFIVNLLQVQNVLGNSQGYRLKLKEYRDLIPVSRNMGNEIINLLHRISDQ